MMRAQCPIDELAVGLQQILEKNRDAFTDDENEMLKRAIQKLQSATNPGSASKSPMEILGDITAIILKMLNVFGG